MCAREANLYLKNEDYRYKEHFLLMAEAQGGGSIRQVVQDIILERGKTNYFIGFDSLQHKSD